MNSAATRKNLAVKNSQVVQVYKEVVQRDYIDWWVIGCIEGKPGDYWPSEGERVEIIEDVWFDRIGTTRLPIRVIKKALVFPKVEKGARSYTTLGKVYPQNYR